MTTYIQKKVFDEVGYVALSFGVYLVGLDLGNLRGYFKPGGFLQLRSSSF